MLGLSFRKKYYLTLNRYIVIFSKSPYSKSSLTKVDLTLKLKEFGEDFNKQVKKQKFRKNFIENLFINKFQATVLEYPELKYLEQVQTLNKQYDFVQQLLEDTKDKLTVCENDSGSSVNALRTHELSGFKLPRDKYGFGFINSDSSFIQEAIGLNPSLAKSVSENDNAGTHLICTYGSDEQKNEYLPKLARGEIVTCFAHLESEPFALIDPDLISSKAELSSDKQNYIITGRKNWVYNAKYADLFILSANVTEPSGEAKPTIFLVPKDAPGVKIEETINTVALKDLNISDVTFDKVIVPVSSTLGGVHSGGKIIREMLSHGKLNNGPNCLPIMRELVNTAINHCIYNKFFGKDKYEIEYFKVSIAEMVCQLYAVESMTYLLTGRLDKFENPDLFLESLIVKVFASENLQSVLQKCINIVGRDIITSDSNWKEIIRDSQFFAASDITNDHLRLVLAISGVQHALNHEKKSFFLKKIFTNTILRIRRFEEKRDYSLQAKQVLRGYLHHIFSEESFVLEDGVSWLYESTKYLIMRYGEKVFDFHWELKVLADIAILVYAETAVLGRASRAYCLGVERAEADRFATEALLRAYHHRVNKLGKWLKYNKAVPEYKKINEKLQKIDCYTEYVSVLENLKIRH